MHTPAEIIATFEKAELPSISLERAEGIARHIRAWGVNARAAVRQEGGSDPIGTDYLLYLSALEEARDLGKRAARMRREAADLDYQADKHRVTADDYAGRVAYLRQHDRHDETAQFQAMADAAEANWKDADEAAHRLRIRAATLEARNDFLGAVADITGVAA